MNEFTENECLPNLENVEFNPTGAMRIDDDDDDDEILKRI